MKMIGKLAIAAAATFAVLQFVRPTIPTGPTTDAIQTPMQVHNILENSCYSCHSNQVRLSWFDQIVPAYWLVRHDILAGREQLNFSTLGSKPEAAQKATLYEAVNMIQLGAMPLQKFTALHPDAKVSPVDLDILKAYLAPFTASLPSSNKGDLATSGEGSAPANLVTVSEELNGLAFEPGFENWKPISFTDRGDNNSFRFVLGNDIAVEAARSGNISPWPDGARFAKIAWQKIQGSDGLIHPGKFIQVEFMVKNAHLYRQTDGWGWGRWRGMNLKPYGKDAKFVGECTSCHSPVRGDDYVYTLPITAAKNSHQEVVNNRADVLPQSLPYQPLQWGAITMYADPAAHTMTTLFGNDIAMRAVRARGDESSKPQVYPPGAVLALVTWVQRDDPHWFGARIPDVPQSIEFLKIKSSGVANSYQSFDGSGRIVHTTSPEGTAQRVNFMMNLTPAVLP